MDPTYRYILLIRRRDGGVESIGYAMPAAEREAMIAAARRVDDPDPRFWLEHVIEDILRRRDRYKAYEIALGINSTAVNQGLVDPLYHTIVAYQPLNTAMRLYCYAEEHDHRDAAIMMQLADQADQQLQDASNHIRSRIR